MVTQQAPHPKGEEWILTLRACFLETPTFEEGIAETSLDHTTIMVHAKYSQRYPKYTGSDGVENAVIALKQCFLLGDEIICSF